MHVHKMSVISQVRKTCLSSSKINIDVIVLNNTEPIPILSYLMAAALCSPCRWGLMQSLGGAQHGWAH